MSQTVTVSETETVVNAEFVEKFIPTIDLSGYFEPTSPTSKQEVVTAVRKACLEHGFLQVVGHGVPVEVQRKMLASCKTIFDLPIQQKEPLSLHKFPWRRGYEGPGQQQPHGAAMPDQKEGFFVGVDLPMDQVGFLKGPNVWPTELPESDFKSPVEEYFNHLIELGHKVWEVIAVSLGHDRSILDKFATPTAMFLKLLRYPAHNFTDARLMGSNKHTDYGGLTLLLQQPGCDGLEVWHDATKQWIAVPAVEDKYVINLGDMVQKWTAGEYKSTIHRVINKVGAERYAVPAFWHGNLDATNPFHPEIGGGETISQHIRGKFYRDYSLSEDGVH